MIILERNCQYRSQQLIHNIFKEKSIIIFNMETKHTQHIQEFEITIKEINGHCRRCRREKGTLGNLIGGFISIAIATTCLGITTESLRKAGVM